MSTNTFDVANRLIESQRNNQTVQPIYDGVGNRVAQVTNGVTTTFALDVMGLPEVIYTSDDTKYLHLPGLIMTENTTGTQRFLLSDNLGSVRQVVDEDGEVVATQTFDPYGNLLAGSESQYGFTGEWWEDDLELLHLRARWYAPEMGIFLSKDRWGGDDFYPQTMNGFNYVYGNPINFIDPSGNIGICFQGGWSEGTNIDPNSPIANFCKDLDGFSGGKDVIPGELRGFNNSKEGIALALQEVIDAKKKNPNEPVVVIGYSWGGAAALEFTHLLNDQTTLNLFDSRWPITGETIDNWSPAPVRWNTLQPIQVDKLVLIDPVRLAVPRNLQGVGWVPITIPNNVNRTLNICARSFDWPFEGTPHLLNFWEQEFVILPEDHISIIKGNSISPFPWGPIYYGMATSMFVEATVPYNPETYRVTYQFLEDTSPKQYFWERMATATTTAVATGWQQGVKSWQRAVQTNQNNVNRLKYDYSRLRLDEQLCGMALPGCRLP